MDATKSVKKKQAQEFHFSSLAKELIIQGVYFLLGVLISRGAVLSNLSPFGASYVSAVSLRYTWASLFGSALGYILLSGVDSFRYIAVILAIGALKWLLSDISRITKSRLFAPVVAFVPMLLTGVALMFVSTSRMSEFGMCLVEALISATGAYFISRSAQLSLSSRGLSSFSQQEVATLTVALCILMLSLGSLSLWGISVGRVMAVITVLMCARYSGVTGGSISGIATGVVFSLGSTDMAFLAGGYAFGGLAGGLFATFGKLPVGAVFTLCSTVMSFASDDKRLVLSLFIECMLSTGLFMLIPSDFGNTIRSAFLPSPQRGKSEALQRNVTMRLDHAAHALEGVNECVSEVSKKLKRQLDPDSDMQIYENAVKSTCASCGLKVYCWDKQKGLTQDDFSRLTEILRYSGFVSEKDVNDRFTKKCCKQRELAENINESYKEYLSELSAQRRITQVRSVVAGQFTGLSDMLWDLSEELQSFDDYDTDSSERITEALKNIGAVVIDCSCRVHKSYGMTVELELAKSHKKELDIKEIHHTVSRCCGRRFELPTESQTHDRLRLVMSEISDYDVEIGSSQHIAGSYSLCGDCLDYFLSGTGSMVAIISDGMGSGGAAAVDSNMAVSVLTRLLKAGISYDCALSVVNSSLMIKSEEESLATLDIADINLFSGKVNLFKAGAPVTYIRKGGRVHRRELPSLPVGILNEVKFSKDAVTLHEGDAVVMISDGAVVGDEKWLEDLIRTWKEASCQDFASLVVNEAMKRRKDTHDDDITAIAMKLVENN
ncbi:MAG: SpoIIE family protein phosphatase [Ruminococcus sp.]|nr:SpoIIE family protein phosphatase [Ruminococcus sp.]